MKNTEIVLPSKITKEPADGGSLYITIEAYMVEAKALLEKAGKDTVAQLEAIPEICKHLVLYDNELKTERYLEELATKFKIKKTWLNFGMKDARKQLADESNGEIGSDNTPLINRVEFFILSRYDIFFNLIANKFMYRKTGEGEYLELSIDSIHRQLKKKSFILFPFRFKIIAEIRLYGQSQCIYRVFRET